MTRQTSARSLVALSTLVCLTHGPVGLGADPLPSWNEGPAKEAIREFAYDRDSAVGRLDKALNEATRNGWIVAEMQRDWRTIYPQP